MILPLMFALVLQDGALNREAEPACDRGGNTLQMNACAVDDLVLEEARMQRYLDQAMARAATSDAESGEYGAPTRQVELLTAAQAAWITYAERRCEAQWDAVKGGTIRTIIFIGCKIDATRQRTHDIWSDHLTHWDSTPPLLPEPILTASAEQESAARLP
jgi:uncharacterized protein YecT (DUF1311 family)